MSSRPLDVLMTAYNSADTISAALESVLSQTFGDFRIIIIDDGSTDATTDIIQSLAALDKRIVAIKVDHVGIVRAANRGLNLVEAPFLARMDADDISEGDRFEVQLGIFDRAPDVVAISGAHDLIDMSGKIIGSGFIYDEPMRSDPLVAPHREPYLPHPFLMVRMTAMEKIGKEYRHFVFAEDVDLYWRLRHAGRLVNSKNKLGRYRLHPDSVTAKSIFHGRVSATFSQLAGISELRRINGFQDISIARDPMMDLEPRQSLEEIANYASTCAGLSKPEEQYLKACAAAKLLELTWRRTYYTEAADYYFMKKWLQPEFFLGDTWNKSINQIEALLFKHLNNLVAARQYTRALQFLVILRERFLRRIYSSTAPR